MTLVPDEFVFEPGAADSPHDLRMALGALLFRDAKVLLQPLAHQVGLGPPFCECVRDIPGPLTASFIPLAQQLIPLCQRLVRDLDHVYASANRYIAQVADQRARRADFIERFLQATTFIHATSRPEAHSLIGWIDDDPNRPLSLSRDAGLLFLGAAAQGFGKTVLSTVLGEACLRAQEPLTSATLPPTSYAFFHVEEHDRLPQLLDGLRTNPSQAELDLLKERLGIGPAAIQHINLVVPRHLMAGLAGRLLPYKELGLSVMPLKVHLGQLGQPALEAALGADTGARYVLRMLEDAQKQGDDLDIGPWHDFIDDADDITVSQRRSAHARLSLLAQIASPPEGPGMWQMFEPGTATVVYLGGPHMGRRDVLPLVVGMLNGLMLPSPEHGAFQRFIVVDEVNLFDEDRLAWRAFTRAGRMVRHLGSTLGLLGQDLMHVTDELFGLAGMVAVGRLRNPRVLEHIVERYSPLRGVRAEHVQDLAPGEMVFGMSEASDPGLRGRWCRARVRPLRCLHGGRTRSTF